MNQCDWKGKLYELNSHIENDCPFAIVTCSYCSSFKDCRFLLISHQLTCDAFEIDCILSKSYKAARI